MKRTDLSYAQQCIRIFCLAGACLFLAMNAAGAFTLNTATEWPLDGIAFAILILFGAYLWPAIWCGSFALNMAVYLLYPKGHNDPAAWQHAFLIATCVTLQAALSLYFLKRYSKISLGFEKISDVMHVFLWGAVGCVIGTALAFAGFKTFDYFAPQKTSLFWGGFATSQIVGVWILTPLAVILLQPKFQISRHRKLFVALPVLVLLALTFYAYLAASNWEKEKNRLVFEKQSEIAMGELKEKLNDCLDVLLATQHLFADTDNVKRHEFYDFTEYFFTQYPALEAIEWVPAVRSSERSAFENRAVKEGAAGFHFSEFGVNRMIVPAKPDRDYLPIYFIRSDLKNEDRLGYNLGSDPVHAQIMKEAALRHTTMATDALQIPGSTSDYKVTLYTPIFDKKKKLQGFVAGVFEINELFDAIKNIFTTYGIAFNIYTTGNEHRMVYDSQTKDGERKPEHPPTVQSFKLAGKAWQIEAFQKNEGLAMRSWEPLLVLGTGSFLTIIIGMLLLLITGRAVLVTKMVAEKTAEIETNRHKLQLLVKNVPAAVAMFDNDMRYLEVSDRWIKDYKLHDKTLIGQSHYDIFPIVLTVPEWMEAYRRALNGESILREDSYINFEGEFDWVRWAMHPWYASNGQIGGIVMFNDIITEQKNSQAALQESEETFRLSMEYASIGMALITPDGKWLKVNKALCSILDYTPDELQGNSFQMISHPDDLEDDQKNISDMISGLKQNMSVERRFIKRDGTVIFATVDAALIRDNNGQPRNFIALIQDITEKKKMEKMKEEFISTVSHELRTPLTSIRGALGLIVAGATGEISKKAIEMTTIAYNNSIRLARIINDILDIDKIESGSLPLTLQPLEIGGFLKQALETNRLYADKCNVTFVLETVPLHTEIIADSDRLMQVMSNLLSNAAKFSKADSKIFLSAKVLNNTLRIAVKDSGIGISDEFRPHIFEKFAQEDHEASRRYEGTGLGLSITKKLVEAMNGKIDFQSKVGEGTVFYIDLPLAQNENKMRQPHSHILLCEPDEDIARAVKDDFIKANIDVDIVQTAEDIKNRFSPYYSALIIDLDVLDCEDGFIKNIKIDPALSNIPVMVIATHIETTQELIKECAVFVTEWIVKPVDNAKLADLLQQAAKKKHKSMPYILHIEDDRDFHSVIAESLRNRAHIHIANNLQKAETYLKARNFDLIILDLTLPDGDGLVFLKNLSAICKSIPPILVLTAVDVGDRLAGSDCEVLLKSRVSEKKIVDKIVSMLPKTNREG